MAERTLTGEFLQLRGDFHRRRRILEEVSAGPDDFGNVLLVRAHKILLAYSAISNIQFESTLSHEDIDE